MSNSLPVVVIVTPSLSDANNGNWRTARRWQSMLRADFKIIVQNRWPAAASRPADLLIALHARRSADSVRAFRANSPGKPVVVALTGTDLYHDLDDAALSSDTLATMDAAEALVVLQDEALTQIPHPLRSRTTVIYQSARQLVPATKARQRLDCVVVGHLRHEKDPGTIFRMMKSVPEGFPITIRHIGAPLDEAISRQAINLSARSKNYRWLGPLSHGLTRAAIKRAHLLVHPSMLEGGANVIAEAVTAGTSVIASNISGNIGMLGRDYPGYFPVGNAEALWTALLRCHNQPAFLEQLAMACRQRARLFAPETERASLVKLVRTLLE